MRVLRRSLRAVRDDGVVGFLSSARSFVLRRAAPIRYGFGSTRVCSVCEWEGSAFLPFGSANRPDASCPNCYSKERHRLLWEYLDREVEFRPAVDLLYFAPIEGVERNLREKTPTTVITTDLKREDVDVKSDITELPYKNNSIDILLCSHVLDVVPDDKAALSELYRILRPGGQALILIGQDRNRATTYEEVSSTTAERKETFGDGNVVRRYGNDFPDALRAAGFETDVVDYVETFDETYVETHRLRESETWVGGDLDHTLIFHCSKPAGATGRAGEETPPGGREGARMGDHERT